MLTLQNVSMYYHSGQIVTVGLSDISVSLEKGEFVAITGASGSGKSTLLNIISMLLPYQDGEIFIDGIQTSFYDDKDREDYRRKHIGMIFQNYNLMDSYTVLENVESAMLVTGITNIEAKQKSIEILRLVGLEAFKDKRAAKLSSGQKQRVSIARALAKEPDIIIADEPTGNLDSENGKQIMELLKELSKDHLVIMATHNVEEASNYISRRITLQDGKIQSDVNYKAQIHNETTKGNGTTIDSINNLNIETTGVSHKDALMNSTISESNTTSNLHNKRKAKVNDRKISLRFALLNMKAQPRKSFLIFALFLLTTLASFIFLGSILSNMDDTWAKYYDDSAFANGNRRRIVVWKSDGSIMTKDDMNSINSIPYVKQTDLYDFSNDTNYYCDYDQDYYHKFYTNQVKSGAETLEVFEEQSVIFLKHNKFMRSITSLTEEDLIAGRLPSSANEIVLYSSDTSLLGSEKTFYFTNRKVWGEGHFVTMNMTIVGILKEETPQVYFSEEMSRAMYINNSKRDSLLWCYEMNINNYKTSIILNVLVFVDDSLTQKDHVILSNKLASEMEKVSTMENVDKDSIILYRMYGIEESLYVEGVTPVGEEESSKLVIKISKELFDEFYGDIHTKQASVYIEDYAYTDDVLKAIKDSGYEAVSPFRISSLTYNQSLVQERLFTLFLSITAFISIFILEIVVLAAFLHVKKKDFSVLTSVGASNKMVKLMNGYEILIHQTSAILVSCILLLAFKIMELSYMRGLFLYYRYYHYIILLFFNFIASSLLILKCNRSMTKSKYQGKS